MIVEIFIFDCDGSILNIIWKIGNRDGGAVLVDINFVEEIAFAVENLSTDRSRGLGELGGIGNIFKKIGNSGCRSQDKEEYKDNDSFFGTKFEARKTKFFGKNWEFDFFWFGFGFRLSSSFIF